MSNVAQPYTSGDWLVKAGSEQEFVERWNAFTRWSAETAPGVETFVLIRAADDPRHFVSYAAWESLEALNAWRQRPEMTEFYSRCAGLCEKVVSGVYTLESMQSAAARVA